MELILSKVVSRLSLRMAKLNLFSKSDPSKLDNDDDDAGEEIDVSTVAGGGSCLLRNRSHQALTPSQPCSKRITRG